MRTGALTSVVSLMIWVVISGAVAWARPTPPASLFGRMGAVTMVVAEAPAAAVETRCDVGC